ncbi:MAG: hypothetical protein H0V43_08610 [Gemmatimonadales bacterium]|nr:hypothetical protein [Gemmatimonadales bacterium]
MAKHRIGQDPAEFQRFRSQQASEAAGQAAEPPEIAAYRARRKVGVLSIPTPGNSPVPEPESVPAPAPESAPAAVPVSTPATGSQKPKQSRSRK